MKTVDEVFLLMFLMMAILSLLSFYWGLVIKRKQYNDTLIEIKARVEILKNDYKVVLEGLENLGESYDKIKDLYHYPECWDTMAYPTFYDAVFEMRGPCTTCEVEPIEFTRSQLRCDHPEDAQVEVTDDPGNIDGIYCMACSSWLGDIPDKWGDDRQPLLDNTPFDQDPESVDDDGEIGEVVD